MPGGPRPLVREADRERLLALLREHYARGELDHDELSRRVGIVLSAKYWGEADAAVADLQLTEAGPAPPTPVKHRSGHAQSRRPAAGWIPTDERFRDPTTGTIMRVWLDPADRSRHYVPDQDA